MHEQRVRGSLNLGLEQRHGTGLELGEKLHVGELGQLIPEVDIGLRIRIELRDQRFLTGLRQSHLRALAIKALRLDGRQLRGQQLGNDTVTPTTVTESA